MHFTVCKAQLKKKIRGEWKSEFSYYRDVQYKLFLLQSDHVLVVKSKQFELEKKICEYDLLSYHNVHYLRYLNCIPSSCLFLYAHSKMS